MLQEIVKNSYVNRMRKIGFFGRDDWGIIDCTLDDLDELIDTGKIKIIDKTTSTIITDKSKSKNAIINQGTNKNKDSNWINRIDFGEIESFKNEGFYGFVSVKSLLNNYSQIPAIRGVYMVLRIITKEPFFLDKGSGGYFKGTDPNVAIKSYKKSGFIIHLYFISVKLEEKVKKLH